MNDSTSNKKKDKNKKIVLFKKIKKNNFKKSDISVKIRWYISVFLKWGIQREHISENLSKWQGLKKLINTKSES